MRELSAKDKAFLNEKQKLKSQISKLKGENLSLLKIISEKETLISEQEEKIRNLKEVIDKYLENTDKKAEDFVEDMKRTEIAKTILIDMFGKMSRY